jgi:hypothetical protein
VTPSTDSFFALALMPSVRSRALMVGLVVGTILALINHADAAINGTFGTKNAIQVATTYFVPYAVSTYSSVRAMKANPKRTQSTAD